MTVQHARSIRVPRRGRQAGIYAVEYALVFPAFFLLIYGALALAIVMFMRIDLQQAAEEGARAALRYQSSTGTRLQTAVTTTTQLTAWMPGPRTVVADICAPGAICQPTTTPASPSATCGDTLTTACRLMVVASYDYSGHPVIPSLPGFGLVLPSVLSANASVLVDAKTLNP